MNVWVTVCLSLFLMNLPVKEWMDIWKQGGWEVGVVDRVEGETSIILLEGRQEEIYVKKERHRKAAREDNWLLLHVGDSQVTILGNLPQLESEQRKQNKELLESLRKRRELTDHSADRSCIRPLVEK